MFQTYFSIFQGNPKPCNLPSKGGKGARGGGVNFCDFVDRNYLEIWMDENPQWVTH